MAEAKGTPPAPQKLKPWVIAIAVIVILCCFCVGVIGLLFAFSDPILHELGLTAFYPFQ